MSLKQQVCVKCVMDTSDPKISFDAEGVCSHCHEYEQVQQSWPLDQYIAENKLEKTFEKIKIKGRKAEFDCVVGLSGGVDSSYVAYLAHKHGLRPLCVHLDNGWNSELATANINNLVRNFNFELHTHVINWGEFKDLQRAFFKADVIDIELLSDHAIFGVIIQLAKKYGIKYILSGANYATEAILPRAWVHRKQDLKNILSIHKAYGEKPLKTFPRVSTLQHVFLMYGLGYKVVKPLNYIDYNKSKAMELLTNEVGWQYYGGKHYESVFTKFYQAHILPVKFGVDKRKAHLSTLICSGQMTRDEAIKELEKPLYDPQELERDKEFFLKKLDFTPEWFENYMKSPPKAHLSYDSDEAIYQILLQAKQFLSRHSAQGGI